ncbi:MAG: mechanosensitive ion channel domain-containing protein [Woeseia sp.]
MEQIRSIATQYGQAAYDHLSQPAIGIQLGLIVLLFIPAWLLARRIEPQLESRARTIKGMPGLLRLVVAFLRRLEWLFFGLLLALAYLATSVAAWPATNYLLYSAMLLAAAWLLISVMSHVIRSRALRKAFAVIAWTYVAATILGITDDIAAILSGAALQIGTKSVSVLDVIRGALVFIFLIWAAIGTGNVFDRRIQDVDELTPSLRVLLGKILRIALLIFAVLIAMSNVGINLTALAVLSGAIGVGIGFGLQKVVSNFFSGIIILMDRSIKPGDTISLGETFGWIRELRARFVSVVTRDGREYLIPNEDFITHEVINWSFSDEYVRLDIPFGVSYDSDPHEVTRLAIEAASGVERVNSTRNSPVCWLTGFGDSSLDFLLRFWIRDPQNGMTNIRGKVLLALWDTFKEHGINIPFPHREVIMRTPVNIVTDGN